jgi:6-phosphogluconate dehydrogenase
VDDKTGKRLVDVILDQARQKGTGMWTSQDAMNLQSPVPTIDAAVQMRDISGFKTEREAAAKVLQGPARVPAERDVFLPQLREALYAAMILTYAQGMVQLRRASDAYHYDLPLAEIAKIWRGGCIIRAALLEKIRSAFEADPALPNLCVDPQFSQELLRRQDHLRAVATAAVAAGIPAPGFMSALAYFDAYRSAWLPANLIQAQRDYFGAHTYERIDAKGVFHTIWTEE